MKQVWIRVVAFEVQNIQVLKKLKEAGNFLDLPILDHLIYSDQGYYSFADEGML